MRFCCGGARSSSCTSQIMSLSNLASCMFRNLFGRMSMVNFLLRPCSGLPLVPFCLVLVGAALSSAPARIRPRLVWASGLCVGGVGWWFGLLAISPGLVKFLRRSPFVPPVWLRWHQDIPEVEVSAESSDKGHLKKISHFIPGGRRFYCWDQFLQTSRHEVSTTAHVQASSLRQVNWSAIRSLSDSSGACRTVTVGGTISPAWFHARDRQPFSSSCPWCPADPPVLGSWHHLGWECPCSPVASCRPPLPVLGITRRFGWSPDPYSVLPYLSQVQSALWDARYRDDR